MDEAAEDAPSAATEIYQAIDDWWGERFDDALVDRMLAAPKEHWLSFVQDFRAPRQHFDCPELTPGILRPVLSMASIPESLYVGQHRSISLRTLTYAHEIVVDPTHMFEPLLSARGTTDCREPGLRQLALMRPFVDDGSIKFADLSFVSTIEVFELIAEALVTPPRDVKEWMQQSYPLTADSFSHQIIACGLAKAHRAQLLYCSELELAVNQEIIEQRLVDQRGLTLQKLAALQVPTLGMDVSSLVSLRRSDPDFAEWRRLLGEALTYVDNLGEDKASLQEASDVVYSQLRDGVSRIETAMKKSPALQAMKGGVTGLALTGLSVATTAAVSGGSPWPSVASGVAVKGAETIINYAKAVKERRKGHLILDVAMMFDPAAGPDALQPVRP